MRELNLTEISTLSGAFNSNDMDGYNYSFIVTNALVVGTIATLFTGEFLLSVGIGATYAGAMLTAKAADVYFFPPE